jgi:integrase/recombinase XerD
MLTAADNMPATSGSPLRSEVYRMAVILLYTTGLRRGELLRLTLADCEPESGVFRVRESKFHKSRILPLSPDAHTELRGYLQKRLAPPFSKEPDTPLLVNTEGSLHPYTSIGIGTPVSGSAAESGPCSRRRVCRTAKGRRPRVHDLRHNSASRIIPSVAVASDKILRFSKGSGL